MNIARHELDMCWGSFVTPSYGLIVFLFMAISIPGLVQASSGDDGQNFSHEALALVDRSMPKMVNAVRQCDTESVKRIGGEISVFLKKEWYPYANKRKKYRSCYALLSTVRATGMLVRPGLDVVHTTGLFDFRYETCKNPDFKPIDHRIKNMHWPTRFGEKLQPLNCVEGHQTRSFPTDLVGQWVSTKVEVVGHENVDSSGMQFSFEFLKNDRCFISLAFGHSSSDSAERKEASCSIRNSHLYMKYKGTQNTQIYDYRLAGDTLTLQAKTGATPLRIRLLRK